MKDIIDERNERERISKSIIKYWNVNYVPTPVGEMAAQNAAEGNGTADTAMQGEMNAADKGTKKAVSEEDYNATTGSYSGSYGKTEIADEVTRGQIDKILHEKTDAIRSLIEQSDEK